MGLVHFVSTDGIATAEKINQWNSGSAEIGGVRATPIGETFKATASIRHIDDLLLFGLKASPHRITARIPARRDEGSLRLRFQRSGRSVLQQDGLQTTIAEGEWLLFNPARPHAIVNEVEASSIFLQIPLNRLSESEIRVVHSCRLPLPRTGRVSGLLFECLRMSLEELGETSRSVERDLGHSMVDLFRLALGEIGEEREQGSSRDLIQRRVRDHIRRNLHDPALSVESIARAMGCSPRYVHKAFEGQGSVSRLIWSERLERCRQCLESEASSSRTLTNMAFDHGFSSSAHFSRKFREQFGSTPSEYRAAHQAGGKMGGSSLS